MKDDVRKLVKWGGWMAMGLIGLAALRLMPVARAAPPSATVKAVTAGDFEGQSKSNKQYGTLVLSRGKTLGWGWAKTDDQRMGGRSTASIQLVHPGADGSHGALRASGELKPGFISPWAGAIWFPGSQPMQSADLSGYTTLTFMARGKPGSYSVMMMAGAAQSIPRYASIDLTAHWKRYSLPLATSFFDADLKHVYFVAFSAGAFGKFHFELDNVQLR
ncbi:MAG TPA: CIA30 family protein [Rhodanobacteraceae bacterium]